MGKNEVLEMRVTFDEVVISRALRMQRRRAGGGRSVVRRRRQLAS